jgi:hypothetical protein
MAFVEKLTSETGRNFYRSNLRISLWKLRDLQKRKLRSLAGNLFMNQLGYLPIRPNQERGKTKIMSQYANDPRWITARFNSKCDCGKPIRKSERVFYYPSGKQCLCPDCGQKASQDFAAAAQDEAFMSGGAW